MKFVATSLVIAGLVVLVTVVTSVRADSVPAAREIPRAWRDLCERFGDEHVVVPGCVIVLVGDFQVGAYSRRYF
jgi:hypothetical protein